MKYRAVGFTLFVLAAAALMAVQSSSQRKALELSQEPHYKELLANNAVRVWLLELARLETTEMHRHRADYLMIQLAEADTSTTFLTDPPSVGVRRQFYEGEMWYLPARVHAVKNESGMTTVRQLEIELLQRGSSGNHVRDAFNDALQPKFFPPPVNAEGNYHQAGTMYNVYLTRQGLLPGEWTPVHEHKAAHLVVALTDLELKSEVDGKPPAKVTMNEGEVRWIDGGFKHKLTNVGNRQAQVVTVEYR